MGGCWRDEALVSGDFTTCRVEFHAKPTSTGASFFRAGTPIRLVSHARLPVARRHHQH